MGRRQTPLTWPSLAGSCSSASALQFLHERNISHLDLKPQNILLSSLDRPHLKLAGGWQGCLGHSQVPTLASSGCSVGGVKAQCVCPVLGFLVKAGQG